MSRRKIRGKLKFAAVLLALLFLAETLKDLREIAVKAPIVVITETEYGMR